jgi:hypothetical protein
LKELSLTSRYFLNPNPNTLTKLFKDLIISHNFYQIFNFKTLLLNSQSTPNLALLTYNRCISASRLVGTMANLFPQQQSAVAALRWNWEQKGYILRSF